MGVRGSVDGCFYCASRKTPRPHMTNGTGCPAFSAGAPHTGPMGSPPSNRACEDPTQRLLTPGTASVLGKPSVGTGTAIYRSGAHSVAGCPDSCGQENVSVGAPEQGMANTGHGRRQRPSRRTASHMTSICLVPSHRTQTFDLGQLRPTRHPEWQVTSARAGCPSPTRCVHGLGPSFSAAITAAQFSILYSTHRTSRNRPYRARGSIAPT